MTTVGLLKFGTPTAVKIRNRTTTRIANSAKVILDVNTATMAVYDLAADPTEHHPVTYGAAATGPVASALPFIAAAAR